MSWAPVATAAVVFARLLQLGYYTQPQVDDFDYAAFYARYGFWGSQLKWYQGWNGRYFFNLGSTAMVALVDFGRSYWIVSVVFLLIVLFVHWYALSEALDDEKKSFWAAIVATAFFVVTCPSRSDAYFWGTGVMFYPLANCGLVVFVAIAAHLFAADDERQRRRATAILVALAFVVIGCNESSMLVLDVLVACAAALALVGRRTTFHHWLVVLLACGVFSLVVVKAPGNDVRQSFMNSGWCQNCSRQGLAVALEKSYEQAKTVLWAWTTQPLLLVATVLAWPAAGRVAARAKVRFPGLGAPWVPFAIAFGTAVLVAVSIFPSWWGKGDIALPRTLNVSYLVFLLGWASGAALLSSMSVVTWVPGFSRIASTALSVLMVYLFATHDTFVAVKKDLPLAPLFRRENRLRFAQIRAAVKRGDLEVVVDPIQTRPSQLFVFDLIDCSDNWPNTTYAEAFGLHKIWPSTGRSGSCGPIPAKAQEVVNPYSVQFFPK
jgi:hypothetical protein